MFTTYILYSYSVDSYYIGSTSNIHDRIQRHNSGRSIYTKRGKPWTLVYQKDFDTKSAAYQYELYLKSQKSRKYIEELIRTQ